MGSSLRDFGGDGDFGGCDGAGGGVVAIGVLVGGRVVTMIGDVGGGVGVLRVNKFSSLMGDEMVIGEESDDDEFRLTKKQGLTLILAVLLGGLVEGDELVDFVIVDLLKRC